MAEGATKNQQWRAWQHARLAVKWHRGQKEALAEVMNMVVNYGYPITRGECAHLVMAARAERVQCHGWPRSIES